MIIYGFIFIAMVAAVAVGLIELLWRFPKPINSNNFVDPEIQHSEFCKHITQISKVVLINVNILQ